MIRVTRRTALASILAASIYRPSQAVAGSSKIMIASAAASGAHATAIDGMQRALASTPIATSTFRLPVDDAAFQLELKNGSTQLAIAVGVDALRLLLNGKARMPLLTTMCFRADLKRSGILNSVDLRLAGAMWLDLQVQQIVNGLRLVFPDADRIAVIRNPAQSDLGTQVHKQSTGGAIRFVDCSDPSELMPELRKLRGQVDFVICLPDSTLYNKTTVEPLILSSLELRLPLVGFSLSFVKAGAAVGVYPDFADIGRQTALMALRCLEGGSETREETPHRTMVAANQRVLHLIGRDYHQKGEEVLLVQ